MLSRFNVPRPEFQADFHGHPVDGIYWRERLIIELDGERDHGQWDRIEQDHIRDVLALEHGFQTVRITWRMVTEHPRRLAGQLRRILALRAPGGAA
jgi:very-short-patch-repair endonuclease